MTAIIIATILILLGIVIYHFGYIRGVRDLEHEIDEGIKKLKEKDQWEDKY